MAIALPIVVPLDVLFVVNEVTSMFSPTKGASVKVSILPLNE
jgi:hypothetical protein